MVRRFLSDFDASGDRRTGRDFDVTTLEEALAELKRTGSVSLVVGSVPQDSYVRVSRRMLGTVGSDGPRRRLLVVPDSDRDAAVDRLRDTGPLDGDHARIVTCNGSSRSAGAHATAPRTGGPSIRRVDGSIADLGVAITEAIRRFDDAAGDLSPGELRVGLDPLPSLLSSSDTATAFGFLHVLTEQIRGAGGMGHVRLTRDRDSEVVRTLEPLFDAVLELRLDGYRLEQRWHLPEYALVSDWLPVPEMPGEG